MLDMDLDTVRDPHELHDELAQALTNARGGKNAGEIAAHLLSNDASGTLLIGLLEDGSPVTYNRSVWTVKATEIPESGRIDRMNPTKLEEITTHVWLERWIRSRETEYFAWVHPRYRWLQSTPE
jgi:hypothetical protein